MSPGLHGGEGDGEEDEETTYTVKTRVFKFTTDREGASAWSEMGVGAYFLSLSLSPTLSFLPGFTLSFCFAGCV